MSRTIIVDGAANYEFVVSDAEYADSDWGKYEDLVIFTAENGSVVALNWSLIGVVSIPGAIPPPGSYPGWRIFASGPYGAVGGLHVNDATKADLLAVLTDPEVLLEFTTLEGIDIKLPVTNVTAVSFIPGDLVIPS